MVLSDEWYTVDEVAELMKVDKSTVIRWVDRKWLAATDLNRGKMKQRLMRVHREDLRAFADGESPGRKRKTPSQRAAAAKKRKQFV